MTKVSYEERDVFMEVIDKAFGGSVSVRDEWFGHDEPAVWKVNWSCCGAQPVKVARDFAKKLKLGCDVATWMNDNEITIGPGMHDERFDDDDVREEIVMASAGNLRCGYVTSAMELIFGRKVR